MALKPETKVWVEAALVRIASSPATAILHVVWDDTWEDWFRVLIDEPIAEIPPEYKEIHADVLANRKEARQMFAAFFEPETCN